MRRKPRNLAIAFTDRAQTHFGGISFLQEFAGLLQLRDRLHGALKDSRPRVTTLDLQPKHVWRFYNDRARLELLIKELKYDDALGQIPTRRFDANALYFEILRLAYNLVVRDFSYTTLPSKIVVSTTTSAAFAGGREKMSVDSTTRSASIPGASVPLRCSSKDA